MTEPAVRLTSLAHGGGCGCKLSPALLSELLAAVPRGGPFPDLLVGTETGDDAAVFRIDDSRAIVSTTDFFMPIVDDPFDFGRIAATNALSDVYAMGGRPLMALAILGMPLGKIAPATVSAILAGGAAACAAAGIPVAGGHSIDAPEPIYGLAVTGLVHPDRVLRNARAEAGDRLILTKPIGVGIASAALKQDWLEAGAARALYDAVIATTTRLNDVGPALAEMAGVHAVTDVTGFGLAGHALEMCRGAGLAARIAIRDVPLLPGIEALARDGCRTGAAVRNWESYGAEATLAPGTADWQRDLICDPQTSGGLMVAVAREAADEVLESIRASGFADAAVVGEMTEGAGLRAG